MATRVIYSGDLTDDDQMWIVDCTTDELFKLLENPHEWVRSLSTLPDWDGAFAPALLDTFAVQISPLDDGHVGAHGELPSMIVQGIHNTGMLTVKPSPGTAAHSISLAFGHLISQEIGVKPHSNMKSDDRSFKQILHAYWEHVKAEDQGRGRKLDYTAAGGQNGYFYAHARVYDHNIDPPGQRFPIVAAYLTAAVFSPDGYMDRLNGMEQVPHRTHDGAPAAPLRFRRPGAGADISFLYFANASDPFTKDAATTNPIDGCDITTGTTNGTTATVGSSTIKIYVV
jgi:hypothetical protein